MYNDSKKKLFRGSTDVIFIMLLFLLFILMVLFVLISGVSVYKNTERLMASRYEERTALAYIINKLHQSDYSGAVQIETFEYTAETAADTDLINALVITEEYEGHSFKNYIYCYGGWIRELYAPAEVEFDPEIGAAVVEAVSIAFFMHENDIVYVECGNAHGKMLSTYVCLRSGNN